MSEMAGAADSLVVDVSDLEPGGMQVVECSVHGARFDVSDGSVVRRPALRPLCTFPVSEELGSDESNSEGSKLRIRIHLSVPI